MENTVWYKGKLGNSCFSHSVRNTGIHRKRYSVQKYANKPKEAIPCWISLCHLFHCAWFSWVETMGQPVQTSSARSCLTEVTMSITPIVLQLWKFVTGSKWFWKREKTSAERSLSSESLLNHASFLGRSHIYMTNLHAAVTVAEYFQKSGIINVLAAWNWVFFPTENAALSATKPFIPTAWPSPLKGHYNTSCLWLGYERGRWYQSVTHCSVVPCWWGVGSEKTSLERCVLLPLFWCVNY